MVSIIRQSCDVNLDVLYPHCLSELKSQDVASIISQALRRDYSPAARPPLQVGADFGDLVAVSGGSVGFPAGPALSTFGLDMSIFCGIR